MERALPWWVGLLVSLVITPLCAFVHRTAIESDLTRKANVALTAANLRGVSVRFDGLHALATGSASLEAEAIRQIRSVSGTVAAVSYTVSSPASSVPAPIATPSTPVGPPPRSSGEVVTIPVTPSASPAPAPSPTPGMISRGGESGDNAGLDSKGGSSSIRGEILFDFNSDRLRPTGRRELDRIADELRRTPGSRVEVGGHTDSSGDETYNQNLSERRAVAVRRYLIAQGIAPARLSARGYGSSEPVASNADAAGRQQNRRITFRVQKP